MKIILNDANNLYEQRLRNYIRGLSQSILLDITLYGPSERLLTLSNEDKYTLSYSRPFFINILKPPLAEFELVFSLEKVELEESIAVVGKVRLKKYIIGALLLFVPIFIYKAYNVLYRNDPFSWFYFLAMPLVLFTYLFFEYLAFRRRVKKFLTSIAN